MKHLGFLLLFLLAITTSWAHNGKSLWDGSFTPKYEVRAVWLTTLNGLDWPRTKGAENQKKELVNILDRLQQAGINTVLFQARTRGTTFYPSSIEPWDPTLTGSSTKGPSYDPLQFCIDECHKRGMECHAWICTIPIGKWNKTGCKELRKKFPKLVKRIGDEAYLNPENAQTADYLARICSEIVSHYDVDGIHLDYIRYPETWKLKISKSKARANINNIVSAINKSVKVQKPWVKLSCSPVGKYGNLTRYRSGGWDAFNAVCQDAQSWMQQGLMDQLYPMMYFQGNHFYPFAIDWQERSYGRTVVPGLGIYFLDPAEGKWTLDVITREMSVAREIGLGHCYFRSKFFTDNTKGIYDFAARFDETPALVPPMTWEGKAKPTAPESITLTDNTLSWQAAKNNNDSPYLLYNVYASSTYPVDVDKACNLIVSRHSGTSLMIPLGRRNYAVTAVDRYGQESQPVQLKLIYSPQATADDDITDWQSELPLITSDGQPITLPYINTLDAQFIVIETIQGNGIGVRPYTNRLDLTTIPDGMYQIRSLGKKGRTHRLALLQLKRNKHIQ